MAFSAAAGPARPSTPWLSARPAFRFLGAVELAREFLRLDPSQVPWTQSYFTWIHAGAFRADYALQVDQLTLLMILVAAGVGWLIQLYSTGYMADDAGYRRFFAYLNLFMFFMLTLVLAANYLVMFVGWEGVGLCSYLLIGFWFLKKTATDAGNKAFWVNRIGDFGFLLGLFLMFREFGTLDFAVVFGNAGGMPVESSGHGVLTAICLLLLVGATGKSAQIPLYVWLPDAMEGPTPVSALIHAATMVTAGVYMVARSGALFLHAPLAMETVAVIGCLTALFAATIALVQTDIKKVLAYSTISQLGYMFLGCGVGAFGAGIFHLMTHAFFKALLFLGAGSVIHALGGEQDMQRMGGLRKSIPWTYATMLAACLAIAGVPGLSGFFSKDEILEAVRTGPMANPLLYALGVLTAGLTAFYIFRLIFLTFHGEPRWDEDPAAHVHESPRNMTRSLDRAGGALGRRRMVGGAHADRRRPSISPASCAGFRRRRADPGECRWLSARHSAASAIFGAPVIAGLIGFLLAWWFYIRRPGLARAPRRIHARRLPAAARQIFHRRAVCRGHRTSLAVDFYPRFLAGH